MTDVVAAPTDQVVLNPLLTVVVCSRDEVLVRYGIRSRFSHILLDDGRSGALGPIIHAYQDSARTGEKVDQARLVDFDPDDVARVIAYLQEKQVLVPESETSTALELQLLFSDLAVADVVVVGDGEHAAEVGRGLERLSGCRVTAVPADPAAGVEPIAAATLENPGALLITALDHFSPAALHALNEFGLGSQTPWLLSLVDGPLAIVGPMFYPGEGPCYAEFEIQFEATTALRDEYLTQKEALLESVPRAAASPIASSLAAAYTTALALQFMSATPGINPSKSIIIDYRDLTVDQVEVLKLPRCPACGWGRSTYPRHLLL